MAATASPFPDHRGHCFEAVPKTDFLAFRKAPRVVRNADLRDHRAVPGERGGELWFHRKVVLVEIGENLSKHRRPDDLVTALHVMDLQTSQSVRDEGQAAIGDSMGAAKGIGLGSDPTVADDGIDRCAGVHEFLNEVHKVRGCIFQIGILHPDQVGLIGMFEYLSETGSEGRPFAEVGGMTKELKIGMPIAQCSRRCARIFRGAIVDQCHPGGPAVRPRHLLDPPDDGLERGLLVQERND